MGWQEIAAEIAQGIAEAGAELGDGSPLRAVLVKYGPPSGPEWDPVPGERVEHVITVIDDHRIVRDAAGVGSKSEHFLTMAAEPGVPAPTVADEVVIAGAAYSVADVVPLSPGGFPLLWEVRLDR